MRGGEQRAGVVQELLTRFGQLDAVAVPGEQRGAEIVFERADLPAEHRLRDVQIVSGAAEVQPVGDSDEVAQLAQVQIHEASWCGNAPKVSPRLKRVLDTHLSRWHRS